MFQPLQPPREEAISPTSETMWKSTIIVITGFLPGSEIVMFFLSSLKPREAPPISDSRSRCLEFETLVERFFLLNVVMLLIFQVLL
ncbi:hypothetical protein BGZ60DRAFT_409651, partial [Tricladium varicosporioides]